MSFSPEERRQILNAIRDGYEFSPTAKAMLDKLLTGEPNIRLQKDDDFAAHPDTNSINFEDDFLDTVRFIDSFGKLTRMPFQVALLHELSHLLNNIEDPSPAQIAAHDYVGDNVRVENAIRADLGRDLRPSYFNSIDVTNLKGLQPAFENGYTHGFEMDLVVVTNAATGPNIDTSGLGSSSDLLIGAGLFDNILKSGGGRDFLYGFYDKDTLDGGAGDDSSSAARRTIF